MEVSIVVGLICLSAYGYLKYKEHKETPGRVIGVNELNAHSRKEGLTKTLTKEIEQTIKDMNDKTYPFLSGTKDVLKEKQKLLTEKIPTFEHLYIRLKEKYKFDQAELLRLSVDYYDWFVCYDSIYSPGREFFDSHFEEVGEMRGKIFEIERRLKEKLQ